MPHSPDWLKKLMNAWAAGLNYYLATHPEVKPRVLTRFEPWMALSFTEGSIGGDIERIDLEELSISTAGRTKRSPRVPYDPEPRGSNGIAIAPALTRDGKALLLINPHTSFFFRSEQQVTSGQGLNVYGAATWGQFFIYQGFNAKAGWMHTSSGVDNVDEFAVERRDTRRQAPAIATARYGGRSGHAAGHHPLPHRRRQAGRAHASPPGARITARSSATENGRWIAFAMMDRPVAGAAAELPSHQGDGPCGLSQRRAASGQQLEQHHLRRRRRARSPISIRSSCRGAATGSTIPSPSTAATPRPIGAALHDVANCRTSSVRRTAGSRTPTTGPIVRPGAFSAKPEQYPQIHGHVRRESSRGSRAASCSRSSKGWTLERLQAAAYDSYQPGFAAS